MHRGHAGKGRTYHIRIRMLIYGVLIPIDVRGAVGVRFDLTLRGLFFARRRGVSRDGCLARAGRRGVESGGR